MSEESFVYTACPGWGDHDYCVLKTIVEDGKIIRTEKAEYPNKKLGCDAHICQKGLESCKQPYNKERLLYPLKRIGERGEGKWEQISWDQALDEIAEKLLQLRDEHGPETVSFWNFIAGLPPMFGLGPLLASRFMSLWGGTDPCQSYGLDNGPQFAGLYTFNNQFGAMSIDPRTFTFSDYIIVWGANPIENQQRVAMNLVDAKENGARIVDIGLVFDGTAGFADWFVPAKPGSDPYLALAMASYMVENDLFDKEYLLEHTIAAYLIDIETGSLARKGDEYLMWNSNTNNAESIPPSRGAYDKKNAALLGTFEIGGRQCKPAFQLLKDHLSTYTLENTEKITGVSAKTLIKLVHEFAAAENPYIIGALGLRYQNQGESYRAFYLLGALVGSIGRVGSGVTTGLGCSSAPAVFNNAGITRPLGPKGNKMKYVRQKDFFEQIKTGDPYPIKAMIITSGNPAHNCPNRSRWIDAFNAMDLVVDIDIWLTDTGELADYVLPDAMPFERMEIIDTAAYGHIVLQEPAIEPMGEAKEPVWYMSELAKRVGLGEYFTQTTEEYLAIKLQTDFPTIANIDPSLTFERLKKEKMVPIAWPDNAPPFDPLLGLEFITDTGRIEFYTDRLLDVGYAFPTYFPPLESPVIEEDNEEYPYQFFSGRQRFFMQSMFTNDPLMIELSGKKPSARINPIDALRENIKDGDKVEVYNQRGHVIATMRLDEAIPPGTIQVWFGWRQRQFEEGTYAELLIPLGDACTTNETGELWYAEAKRLYGEDDMPNAFATGYAGGWDTIWDCACAVRKIEERKGA